MQVVVDTLLTTYETQGKGKKTVLLLHGWGDRAAGFKQLQAALAKKYYVIALDLPGFGATEAPRGVWGLDDYAQFVAHFLEKIGKRTLVGLVGHSNGGAIAIRGLAKDWLQADKLVLLASAGIRGEYKGRVKALRLIAKTGKALTAPLPASVKKRLRSAMYATAGSDMLVAEQLQETFKKVITDDVRADAAQLNTPTLLVYGEQDPATPVRYGEMFHQVIDGSTLEVLPGAGHFVHLDRPHEVVVAIEGFVA